MYLCVYDDSENESFGKDSINGNVRVLGVSESISKLKELVDKESVDCGVGVVNWEESENECLYGKVDWGDDEVSEQMYVIMKVNKV